MLLYTVLICKSNKKLAYASEVTFCYVEAIQEATKSLGGFIMNVQILNAKMTYTKDDGHVGAVHFQVEGHPKPYEMALHKSRKAKEWGYGLFFLAGSGDEDLLLEVEDEIEENDELYEKLVEAAIAALEQE